MSKIRNNLMASCSLLDEQSPLHSCSHLATAPSPGPTAHLSILQPPELPAVFQLHHPFQEVLSFHTLCSFSSARLPLPVPCLPTSRAEFQDHLHSGSSHPLSGAVSSYESAVLTRIPLHCCVPVYRLIPLLDCKSP